MLHSCYQCGVEFECELSDCKLPFETLCGECLHELGSLGRLQILNENELNEDKK